MIAHVMAWHDTERNDYRALIDVVNPDGTRTPGGAARADDAKACGDWINGVVFSLGATEVRTTDCGEMRRPSFAAVRGKAALMDMRSAGAI